MRGFDPGARSLLSGRGRLADSPAPEVNRQVRLTIRLYQHPFSGEVRRLGSETLDEQRALPQAAHVITD